MPRVNVPGKLASVGVFLFDGFDQRQLLELVEGLSHTRDGATTRIDEIIVMLDRPDRDRDLDLEALRSACPFEVCFHHPPRPLSPGAVRKAAFEYALHEGFDLVVVMYGDGRHPCEALSDLLARASQRHGALVIGSRLTPGGRTARTSATRTPSQELPLLQELGLRIGDRIQNSILNLRVADYQSSYRVYPRNALDRIPWQLNSDQRDFDAELLVQVRALDVPIIEEAMPRSWSEHGGTIAALTQAARDLRIPLAYRMHQLHFSRDHRFMVDRDIHYTLKVSPTGSHMQIIDKIEQQSRVLDLGCSQGLLARPLEQKGVRITGVDINPPEKVASEMETYYQRDLDEELDIPEERSFDYVVVADVIEHIRNRQQLLRSARRYLKEDGRLIISTPNIAIWFYRLSLLVGRFEYGPRGVLDYTHVHLYTRATFRREVEAAGFRVVECGVTALPFEIVFEATGKSKLIRGLADFYYFLAKLWPSMFAYQNIIEAEIITLDEESTAKTG